MDARVRERLDAKIGEALARRDEIARIAETLGGGELAAQAVVAGMLYNSFYYQTRRICARDPTGAETDEFVKMLADVRDRMGPKLR